MNLFKKIFTSSTTYLLLYAIMCCLTLAVIKYGDISTNFAVRIFRLSFLFLFYLISVKFKPNRTLILVLISLPIISLIFVDNPKSAYALILLCCSRALLIKFALQNTIVNNINWKVSIYIIFIFIGIGTLLLSLFYNNSSFFYLAIASVILLILLLSITFINLLETTKKGNLEFFTAISLFVISDTISGVQHFADINATFLILGSIFYNIAFYFIVKSDIIKQNNA